MDAYVARADDAEARPLVVVFMDIWGLREELFAIARRIAAEGYYCMVPNLFYRQGKFSYAPRNAEGRTLSFDLLADDKQREMRGRAGRPCTPTPPQSWNSAGASRSAGDRPARSDIAWAAARRSLRRRSSQRVSAPPPACTAPAW
jgi:dienelactone hydrolase